ncbi:MAG: hypothetical protein JKY92_05240 [Magnetovibrio sp.]|nr:hypothetical protein [Magnetovibrio sp.]
MNWLSENWILVVALGAMGGMHLFGHSKGGGGCCGGRHKPAKPDTDSPLKIDTNKPD